MGLVYIILSALLMHCAAASSLAAPPDSAVVIAFEDVYDLSLLAYTISDLGVQTTFVVPSDENNFYERLNETEEVIKVDASHVKSTDTKDVRALKLCESFISHRETQKQIHRFEPTFVIFPGVRHDACLLPWASSINSIPVIWARGHDEELYVFIKTGMALPVHQSGLIQGIFENVNLKFNLWSIDRNYIGPTQQMMKEKMPQGDAPLNNLYSSVQLVLWGADPVLRMNSAPLTQLIPEIGCHHCRGNQPLPSELQKDLVQFKTGTVIVLLDKDHGPMILAVAKKLYDSATVQTPVSNSLAVIWKNKQARMSDKPNNLFIHKDVDRQDLIGYSRARLVLAHCTDSEFLESAFHGTPIICFPRTLDEWRNSRRAADLGFGHTEKIDSMSDTVVEIVMEMHENTKYRENARIVSQAIRDRSNHAMDRLIYWLRYTERHKGEGKNLLVPKKVSTYDEIIQWVIGFLFGVLFSVMATVLFFFLQQVNENKIKEQRKKHHRK
ncbi:UDP-glucuronosyltransferase 1A8-like [Phymastichus coffea]|uniref:UDP-glucuronosyltransferase 1A8-like n=1 Tax=Phymastichus coffea TaxID=108790 RepID=UPI00273AB2CB|nr:UDP-glucuronosyltransferase 1A8-like [Phymastichus coffea]